MTRTGAKLNLHGYNLKEKIHVYNLNATHEEGLSLKVFFFKKIKS